MVPVLVAAAPLAITGLTTYTAAAGTAAWSRITGTVCVAHVTIDTVVDISGVTAETADSQSYLAQQRS